MAVLTPFFGFISLILLGGAVLLNIFILLGGAVDKNPTDKFYFLEADTSGIANAAPLTRWTLWNACSVVNGVNSCPKAHAAYPFDPPRDFDVGSNLNNIPPQFLGTKRYYYLTRFMFAFFLIALVFNVLSFFSGLLALCSRIGSYLSSALAFVAFAFQALTAALMTAAYVQGQKAFKSQGRTANLGKYDFGFMWATVVCLFLSTVLLCAGGAAGGRSSGGGSRFRRKKSTKARGSFIDRSSFEKSERPNGV